MELPRADRLPVSRRVLVLAGALALVSAASIAVIDQPVARWLAPYEPSPLWNRGIDLLEWAIGLPIFKLLSAVLLVVAMLVTASVPRLRVHAPVFMLLAGTHLVTRLVMIYTKELTGRLRPHAWLEHGGDGTFFRDGLSFPSGHGTLFASLVIPIVVLYPRWRPLAAIVAFVMVARVAVNDHYVSDVIAAVALVLLVTWAIGWLVRPCRQRRPSQPSAS